MTQSTLDDYQDSGCIDHTDAETLQRLYWQEGLSQKQIAGRSSVTRSAIQHQMDKHGIEKRDNTKAAAQARRTEYVYLEINNGYYTWVESWGGSNTRVKVSRLLAVAEYGFDAVKDKHVHHKNGVKWLDIPENIELMNPSEHHRLHSRGAKTLDESDVREIKRLLRDTDLEHQEIGERFGVSDSCVGLIAINRNWGYVDPAPRKE